MFRCDFTALLANQPADVTFTVVFRPRGVLPEVVPNGQRKVAINPHLMKVLIELKGRW